MDFLIKTHNTREISRGNDPSCPRFLHTVGCQALPNIFLQQNTRKGAKYSQKQDQSQKASFAIGLTLTSSFSGRVKPSCFKARTESYHERMSAVFFLGKEAKSLGILSLQTHFLLKQCPQSRRKSPRSPRPRPPRPTKSDKTMSCSAACSQSLARGTRWSRRRRSGGSRGPARLSARETPFFCVFTVLSFPQCTLWFRL